MKSRRKSAILNNNKPKSIKSAIKNVVTAKIVNGDSNSESLLLNGSNGCESDNSLMQNTYTKKTPKNSRKRKVENIPGANAKKGSSSNASFQAAPDTDPILSYLKDPLKVDSQAILLTQALKTDDKVQLNNILCKTDTNVIWDTINDLPVRSVISLLHYLKNRLNGKAATGFPSAIWLKVLLSRHHAYISANSHIADLSDIGSILHQRLPTLNQFLSINGRLEMIQNLMQSSTSSAATNEPPLLDFYEDVLKSSGGLVATSDDLMDVDGVFSNNEPKYSDDEMSDDDSIDNDND